LPAAGGLAETEYMGPDPQCAGTLGEIAEHLDVHYTTVSKVANEDSENRNFRI
jgi:hypothetical protein